MINEYLTDQDILKQVSKRVFDCELQTITQKNPDDEASLEIHQIKQLAAKVCLLPEDWQDALLLYYGCNFDTELSGELLSDHEILKKILYAKDTLAHAMGVFCISQENLSINCHIVLRDIQNQVKQGQQDNPKSTSKKLNKKIHRMIRNQGKSHHFVFNCVARRVAMVFLALLMASTIMILSIEALRTKIFDWFFSVLPTHTRVEFVDTLYPFYMGNADQLKQYAPNHLPKGFVLVETLDTDTRYKMYYANPDEKYIIFEVRLISDQMHTNINTENTDTEEIILNGKKCYYVYNELGHIIFWEDGLFLFTVICETSKNDTIKIAESTKIR